MGMRNNYVESNEYLESKKRIAALMNKDPELQLATSPAEMDAEIIKRVQPKTSVSMSDGTEQRIVSKEAKDSQTSSGQGMSKAEAGVRIADALNKSQQGNSGNTDTASSVGSGALSGAATGFSVGGPMGAAVGAGAGALVGVMQARAARKEKERQALAAHYNKLAEIEQTKVIAINQAMQNMGAAMGASLNRQRGVRL